MEGMQCIGGSPSGLRNMDIYALDCHYDVTKDGGLFIYILVQTQPRGPQHLHSVKKLTINQVASSSQKIHML